MSSPPVFELQAELCRALSHALRLELIHLLREGPKRVGDLAQQTGNSSGAVSRHLAVLRNTGIVTARHTGRDLLYQIVDPRITELCDLMRQVLVEQAARRSQAFKSFDETNE